MTQTPATLNVAAPSLSPNTREDNKELTRQLLADLESTNTQPLWQQMARLNPHAPNPLCVPHLWKFDEIRPHLLRAGDLVTADQAERQVLMLINPNHNAPYTTDTLSAGLQLVMPNEVAPAHRHTAFVTRFIIEGQGGFTAVHGKMVIMNRGDVILTPTWNWHDHGKDGSGPMIWLDGVDLPNFRHYPVHFVEHFEQPRYPAKGIDTANSPIVFPWSRMQARLDASNADWIREPYLKQDGREVSKVLGGSTERIVAGKASSAIRETASSVYHVVDGAGYSVIEGQTFVWKAGDTCCIPSWHKYQHFADADKTVYLYRFDDKPMLKSLGFLRTEGVEVVPAD